MLFRCSVAQVEYANDDIDKLEYPARSRWMAHYWYAKVLLEKRNTKKASRIILLAQQDAQSLGPKEQADTQQLAQEIQAKKSVVHFRTAEKLRSVVPKSGR